MRALLLAAGLGVRLRPLTNDMPKCLVPIQGKALLDYWLRLLTQGGVHPVLVNLHYFAHKVQEHIGHSEYQKHVETVYESDLLGTGGTVLKNRGFFGTEPFMLVHADNLSDFNVQSFIARHQTRPAVCEITMMTFKTSTPETCGIVQLDQEGVVQDFYEKVENPPGNLANGAVYILEPSVIDFLQSLGKEKIDFSTEVLPYYRGKIYTFHNNVYHRDIGSMESYKAAESEFSQRIKE